jgi:TetR/AcrR family transcriptional regulator
MKRGRKKAENPETAQRILAAAEIHFAEHGLAGARTDEIAAAAHANKAMLYYYFGSKQRLHRAVLENLLGQLNEVALAPGPRGAGPRDRLLRWVNGYFSFLATHPNYPRLVQRESMDATPEFQWIVKKYFRPFHRHLSKVIEDGVAAGELRKVDAHQTVFSLLGMTAFYFVAARSMGKILKRNLLSPEALEVRRRAMLDFVECGLLRKEKGSR